MNSDLGFLGIFIILPTVLIVSGFWLMFIVRNDMRLRRASETTMPELESATESSSSSEEQSESNETTARDKMLEDAEGDEEFWTPLQPDVPAIVTPIAGPIQEEADSQTDSDVSPELLPPPPVFANDTENLPDQWEVDLGTDEADEDDEELDNEQEQLPRQSGSLMVPSTEHVMRRTGQAGRRLPTVGRPSSRDEDVVERPDRG